MPKVGTAGGSLWDSTELSLCKKVELWELACPPFLHQRAKP